ncbi:hypothetical protein DQ04_00141160 [Trypanosoma grayi]|uniref:hypothetical protein n=1 Tax=Trypanosoma grayi TaxID=71804 RepID=UPI0004F45C3F|nr:hypothetical protein DQ04_00141160 [Trypanosoma grayi]KEG15228.1 hypothetical protein DQ04_00141160 [Trypanosoma grayi]
MCAGRAVKDPVLESLFHSILGEQEEREGGGGVVLGLPQLETLAEMIGVSLDDSSMYRLAWSWSCQTPLGITKSEFMNGMQLLSSSMKKAKSTLMAQRSLIKATSKEFEPYLSAIRNHIDAVDVELHNDSGQFRRFYRFIFRWVRAPETTARNLGEMGMNVDTAVELWRMLFPEYGQFSHLDDWITFCTTKELFRREAVSRDLWEQLLEFTALTRYDTYDVNDAWPSAIDDFVEHFKATRGKPKTED